MNEPRSCTEWKGELVAFLDGDLGAAARAALEAHLSTCAACRADLAEIETTSAFVRRWEPAEPPRDLVAGSFAGFEPWRTAATVGGRRAFGRRSLRELLVPAGLGAALAAAAVTLLFRLGMPPTDDTGAMRDIQALGAEVSLLRAELAAAQSALARPAIEPAGAEVGTELSAADRSALLREVAAMIAASESRQDSKFLFTTDQLARSMSMQRREDLATIERQLRDSRAETFQAILTTHERLDRLAQPAVLERDGPESEHSGAGSSPRGGDGRSDPPHEDRLEPRW
jgi:anti-sigma factor RsiW